jgi:hypothetical protein
VGSVQVELGATTASFPFRSDNIEGGEDFRSGDRVKVTLDGPDSSNLKVSSIEAVPTPAPANVSDADAEEDPAADMMVTVQPEGGTEARFSREEFIKSGSRLTFG